ncbi:hypothetical protein SMSP2_02609 [Limihaloglobus sulfuriphilus]|uniref:Glycosyltransferase RgtA/B/C/D-like domain-containing protein n=1 Tax=Limihaloglobus sulfuriphilus TaxID=1851148 RepID=A0A1Q2MI79_9BACT|nr:DUF2723 domain-containing protein [Limihaloglobus sulfuriphilus]AQQ72228.1 hypothetical protein SMSP2_02609 [Limihaloglobus sulfuriphilus]
MNKHMKYWLAVFVVFLGIYIYTLAPDVVWQDQGDYQYRSAVNEYEFPGDVVRAHPLYVVIAHAVGRLTPMSYAYAANFTSAFFAAISVANVFVIVYFLTGRSLAGILAAGLYGLAHTTWFNAVQAQTYSMSAACLSLSYLLFIMYRRYPRCVYLLLIGFVSGLGMSTHIMSQIGFAVIFCSLFYMMCKGPLPWKHLLWLALLWFAGAFMLWHVMWLEFERTGELFATIASAVWGKWGGAVFNFGRVFHLAKQSFMFFVLNFPTPLVLLAVLGVVRAKGILKDNVIFWSLLVSLGLYVLFAFRYDIPNQNNFFLPAYMLVAIYAGLGLSRLFKRDTVLLSAAIMTLFVLEILTYPAISHIARSRQMSIGTRRTVPYRDEYSYYLIPWQQNQTGPRQLFTELFDILPKEAVLLVDSTVYDPLMYVIAAENPRPDIFVYKPYAAPDIIEVHRRMGCRFYVVSKHPAYIPDWVEPDELAAVELPGGAQIYEIIIDES